MIKNPKFWLILILVLAAFLRFYRLDEYLRFLGDEGRDVLVVKRMIVDHQWTLLGPTASVGGFYTGPNYYYFMVPFLWAFQLDPVGPAVMAALFGLATVALVYYFCRDFFDEKTALIAAFLTAIAPKMVETSRFSWNPNPIPFFALGTIYSLYQAAKSNRSIFPVLAGIGLGILYQLHYMDLIFIPIVGLSVLLLFPITQWPKQFLLISLGFLAGDSLFLLFELRHGFPNTRSALDFIFGRQGKTVSPRSFNIIWLINDITRMVYEIVLGFNGTVLNLLKNLSFISFFVWVVINKNRHKTVLLTVWWLVGALGIGLYQGTLLPHYFETIFLIPIIFLALACNLLLKKKILIPLVPLILLIVLLKSVPKLYLWQKPNNQVSQTKVVDNLVLALSGDQPFNFALITAHNSDHAYRYFLEVWGQSPVTIEPPQTDPARKSVTNQLIVVCEEACAPLGNPTWEVAGFGRGEIVSTQQGPAGINVFKLVHYKGG